MQHRNIAQMMLGRQGCARPGMLGWGMGDVKYVAASGQATSTRRVPSALLRIDRGETCGGVRVHEGLVVGLEGP
jgi:hypothetical protein